MIVLGLTGGIAMGKTVIARQFSRFGARICDADSIVHTLLGPGGAAVEKVGKLFPEAKQDNRINRRTLGQIVFADDKKLKQLEAVLHPLVRQYQTRFIRKARVMKTRIVVLDIPLLFETQGEKRCDYTVLAIAPKFLQRHRALLRPGMTEEKLAGIIKRQMPDHLKRKRADFLVLTGIGKYTSLKMVQHILKHIGF